MKEKGFTLIELLITIAIFSILVLAIVLFFQKGTETWVRSQPYLEAQEMARKAFYGEIGSRLGMIRELKAADTITALTASSIEFQRGIIDGGNRTCEASADTSEAVQVFAVSAAPNLPAPGLTVVAPIRGQILNWLSSTSLGGDDKRPTIKYRLEGTNLIREVRKGTIGWGLVGSFVKDKDFDFSNNPDDGIIATDVAGLNFSTDLPDTPTLTITIDMGIDYKGDDAYEGIKTFSTTIRLPNI